MGDSDSVELRRPSSNSPMTRSRRSRELRTSSLKKNCKIYFNDFVFKIGPNLASFFLFSFLSQCKYKYCTNLTINDKSIDGVLGTQIQGVRIEGTDESTELWWNPYILQYFIAKQVKQMRMVQI